MATRRGRAQHRDRTRAARGLHRSPRGLRHPGRARLGRPLARALHLDSGGRDAGAADWRRSGHIGRRLAAGPRAGGGALGPSREVCRPADPARWWAEAGQLFAIADRARDVRARGHHRTASRPRPGRLLLRLRCRVLRGGRRRLVGESQAARRAHAPERGAGQLCVHSGRRRHSRSRRHLGCPDGGGRATVLPETGPRPNSRTSMWGKRSRSSRTGRRVASWPASRAKPRKFWP